MSEFDDEEDPHALVRVFDPEEDAPAAASSSVTTAISGDQDAVEEKKVEESDDDEKKVEEAVDDIRVDETLMGNVNEMELIREDIAKTQALVSELKPLDTLLAAFSEHRNFSRQITDLIKGGEHTAYRQLRADGSCFYRAFMLGLFEYIERSGDSELLATVTKNATSSCARLVERGYESISLEDFYEGFMDELALYQTKLLCADGWVAADGMGNTAVQRLSNESLAMYLIFWGRMLTSLYILENADFFASFCAGVDILTFVKTNVEALHSEADHPQFVALAQALGVPVRVFCLENIDSGGPQIVTVPDGCKPVFDLLYRPGHYDILYRTS